MLSVRGFYKSAELDSYEDGCIGERQEVFIDYKITALTLDELKEKIAEFIGCEIADLELDACDEVGRIDADRIETADGDKATTDEINRWKADKCALYYAVYSCMVEECRAVSVA